MRLARSEAMSIVIVILRSSNIRHWAMMGLIPPSFSKMLMSCQSHRHASFVVYIEMKKKGWHLKIKGELNMSQLLQKDCFCRPR